MLATNPAGIFYLRDIFSFIIKAVCNEFRGVNFPDDSRQQSKIYPRFKSFYQELMSLHKYPPAFWGILLLLYHSN